MDKSTLVLCAACAKRMGFKLRIHLEHLPDHRCDECGCGSCGVNGPVEKYCWGWLLDDIANPRPAVKVADYGEGTRR